MLSLIITLLSSLQSLYAAYTLYLSYLSITNLQKYEAASKKAASWSSTAADQLWKTRSTQASGTLAVLLSFISSLSTLFYSTGRWGGLGIAIVNVIALTAARTHVGDFWEGKGKLPLPGTGEYNDAIRLTGSVKGNSGVLIGTWGVWGLLGLL